MNYLDSKLILYLVVIFLTVFIFIKLKTALVIRNLSNKVGVRFYYKFLGNIQWLKEQILMGKYLEMKYLNAVDDKNNSNIIILLEKKEEQNIINIYSAKSKTVIIKNLRLNDQRFKKFIEFLPRTLAEDDFSKESETNDLGRE
ncbi:MULTISPECIES: hypothetical protein [Fusobacterium]|uniref:hypothetical protein n=1 Tax=Fusobacterium TaxID=848 RepID=UPI0025DC5FE2|nr:hypothetical protein [Fusobacterium ulcerans]